MTYAVKQDMLDRFKLTELVQITRDDEPDATTVDDTELDRALADADAVIDLHIGQRYTLPLATTPRVLKNIACDLARARLYEDRITDHVRRREEDAMKLLEMIRAGEVGLGLDEADQAVQQASAPSFTEPRRVFSADSLGDYSL